MMIWQVVEVTLAVSIVALLILVMKAIFHDKLDARWHYLIWLVLAVRILIPVDCHWLKAPISLFEAIPLAHWIQIWQYEAETRNLSVSLPLLLTIYVTGAGFLFCYDVIGWILMRIAIARGKEASEGIYNRVNKIAEKYGLKGFKRIRLLQGRGYCVFGFWCPVLLLPTDIERDAGKEEYIREEIVLHELFHMKYGDVLINYILHLVRTLHWFNPLIWYVTAVIRNDCEALCDQRVLEAGKQVLEKSVEEKQRDASQKAAQKAYGQLLMALAEGQALSHHKIGTSDMANSGRSMQIRIRRIVDFGKVPSGIGFAALCITVVLSISSVAYYNERIPLLVAGIDNESEFEEAIRRAELYQVQTPEEALVMYLQAMKYGNPMYLLTVTPREEKAELVQWIRDRFAAGDFYHDSEGRLFQEKWVSHQYTPENPYFIIDPEKLTDLKVYNLLFEPDEHMRSQNKERLSSVESMRLTVDMTLREMQNNQSINRFIQWELMLWKEDGWRIRRIDEKQMEDHFEAIPVLFSDQTLQGQWLVEAEARNEVHFSWNSSIGHTINRHLFSKNLDNVLRSGEDMEDLLLCYRNEMYYLTYQGKEEISNKKVTVLIQTYSEEELKEKPQLAYELEPELEEKWKQTVKGEGTGFFSSSAGFGYVTIDGKELMNGQRKLIQGGGNGYDSWTGKEKLHYTVWIVIDGECVEVITE